jgi:hypothetical protein
MRLAELESIVADRATSGRAIDQHAQGTWLSAQLALYVDFGAGDIC